MDVGDPDQLEQALDTLHTDLDHLIKLVEDRALETLDDSGLVGFLQGSSGCGTGCRCSTIR